MAGAHRDTTGYLTTGGPLLAVIGKRRFLDVGREGGGLVEFEAEVVEVVFRRRMGAEFVDYRSEMSQRGDRGQRSSSHA